METFDLTKELWSIANIVIGFAVMHGLGFCLASAGGGPLVLHDHFNVRQYVFARPRDDRSITPWKVVSIRWAI